MIQVHQLGKGIRIAVTAGCIAILPGALMASSLTVDRILAVDSSGSVRALRIVGEGLDSGNRTSLTLGEATLEIERSNSREIVATLPDDLEPGRYELVISVTDEVNRIDQAVGIEIHLPASRSAADGNSHRIVVWSSAGEPPEMGRADTAKALSGYQRRSLSGASCPNNFFCMRRVGCISGYFVSGGGMAISGDTATDAYLVESFPFSNTSWEARILNQSGSSQTTTTWAVCVR